MGIRQITAPEDERTATGRLALRLGPESYAEYLGALSLARTEIEEALRADDPVHARRALKLAAEQIGRADTRLSAHAAPPS